MGKLRSAGVVTPSAFTDPVMFSDGFESGNFNGWTGYDDGTGGEVGVLGAISVKAAAALNGSAYGMEHLISGLTYRGHVYYTLPSPVTEWHTRFYFAHNQTTSAAGGFTILRGLNAGGTTLFRLIYRLSGSTHGIRIGVRSTSSEILSTFVTMPDVATRVEIEWRAVASGQRSFRLWFDDVLAGTITTANSAAYTLNQIRIGSDDVSSGAGTLYFDDVKMKALTFIGA